MSIDSTLCVGVIGLGYVGLPLARLLATKYKVVGFDIDDRRISELQAGNDWTGEIDNATMRHLLDLPTFSLTTKVAELANHGIGIYIICVPTPVDVYNRANLKPLRTASKLVGSILKQGDLVIYESTVYPGVTEDECVPCLASSSRLTYNEDFFVGYSPERINPGDKVHTVEQIKKVTSGSTPDVAARVDKLYASIIKAGTHPVSSIRVAEASKIIENTQRDINIAFMNELAKIFNAMGIDTGEVIEAASTKWNFIPMKPGLVGGHCIGIDPYYLIQKAQIYGVIPRLISEARRLNDSMGAYVASEVIRLMNKKNIKVKGSRILLLGFSFKENCADIRNTKVADIYNSLQEYTPHITVHDPHVNVHHAQQEYDITIAPVLPIQSYDAIVIAVAHQCFQEINFAELRNSSTILYDVKGMLPCAQVDGRL